MSASAYTPDLHDADTVACPNCYGATIAGMVRNYGQCARCLKTARRQRIAASALPDHCPLCNCPEHVGGICVTRTDREPCGCLVCDVCRGYGAVAYADDEAICADCGGSGEGRY